MAKGRIVALCLLVTSVLLVTSCGGDEQGTGATSDPTEAADAQATEAPTATPEPIPTPNQSGIYEDLTAEQTQEMVPFDVLVPDEVPSSFELSEISAEAETLQTGFGDPVGVQFWFTPVEGDPVNIVEVSQHAGTVLPGSDGERTQLDIAGADVTRVKLPERDDGQRMVAYNWTADEYSVSVSGMTGADVETDDLEELIRSFLEN